MADDDRACGPKPVLTKKHKMIAALAEAGFKVLIVGPSQLKTLSALGAVERCMPSPLVRRTCVGKYEVLIPSNGGQVVTASPMGARGRNADVLVTAGVPHRQLPELLPVLATTGGFHLEL